MTLRALVPLALCLAVPFVVLYGFGRLARWCAGRRDPIDALITAPKWCKDGEGWMSTVDHQKVNRAGEHRWQETLRAQRRARKPETPAVPAKNVIPIRRTRRSA